MPLAIVVLTGAIYLPTLGFEFVYDDYAQIVETKQLNSWRMIPHYFTGHVWAWKTPGVPGPYYRPVFLLWLLANQLFFGLSPLWWHLTSVLTHLGVTLLVYALATKLSGDRWVGAIASLLFGVHPAHLESVAWVSGITDPLLAVFLLGAMLCYLRREPKWQLASLALYGIALLEKETAVILPCLIFAHAWLFDTPAKASVHSRLKLSTAAALPSIFLTSIYLGLRLSVLHALSIVITPVPWRDMAFTWPSMFVFYLRHLVWPGGLSVLYSLPVLHRPDLWHFAVPCLILAAVASVLVLWSLRSPVAAFSSLILFLPLLPAMNLRTFARVEVVHDRYLYLPSIGFAILVALALRNIRVGPRRLAGHPVLQWALLLLLSSGLAFGVIQQGQYWSNNLSLFTRAVSVAPNNEIANQCLGTALLLHGRTADAVPYYMRALESNPNMPDAQYSLGRCFYELGMYADSEAHFERAASLQPYNSKPYLYYGLAKFREGQLDLAERALRYAIRIKGPDDYREYHLSLGLVLQQKGAFPEALREFEAEALENPDPSKALQHIAEVQGMSRSRR